ncbi:MAG TPA: hypothetical protein DD412_05280 [Holosporales bacterium]|nr:hypothetical protein [Holosporales bacterium]
MRAYQIGFVVILISCNFLVGAAYADYETAKLFAGENKYTQAFEACWEDAQNGDSECQNYIGYLYIKGRGVDQSNKEAMKWWKLAATQGSASAQWRLGLFSYKAKNNGDAVKWWKLAAAQGYAKAQHSLSVAYTEGTGVTRDDIEAAKWAKLAAGQGHSGSQTNLGNMYSEGRGLAQNDDEAVKWWRLAADQGVAIAQYNLGRSYEDGCGVLQNDKTAIELYRLAANQKYEKAQKKLDFLLQKIALEKPVKSSKEISEEKILYEIFGKTIEGWEIKKEYENIIKILRRVNSNQNPKFIVALFSSNKSDGSNIKAFFCKMEIEYKKIAGELFLVNMNTIESESGKKYEILDKYYKIFYPLCSAVKDNNENLVRKLLNEGENVNESDNYYFTPLLLANSLELKVIERLLISRGADIHIHGASLLATALLRNDFTAAKELLNKGVDINSKSNAGLRRDESAIEKCVGSEPAFKFLIENEADIDVKNYYGGSLLHNALSCMWGELGSLYVVKYLIEKGLDINAVDSYGRTPLIKACDCRICEPEYIQLLLDNGAKINIEARHTGTAYDHAKNSGCNKNIKSIINKLR